MSGQAELLMVMANSNQAWKSRFERGRIVKVMGSSSARDNGSHVGSSGE